jgi:hypothetical protein
MSGLPHILYTPFLMIVHTARAHQPDTTNSHPSTKQANPQASKPPSKQTPEQRRTLFRAPSCAPVAWDKATWYCRIWLPYSLLGAKVPCRAAPWHQHQQQQQALCARRRCSCHHRWLQTVQLATATGHKVCPGPLAA